MMMKNMRILIVEDNMDMAENISDFLEASGHVTDFAIDGVNGLQLALTETYDVIILDLMLPGMDGLDVCRELRRKADTYVPVLMLTARDTLDDKLLGFDCGADDYLVKPFALQELSARLQALTKRESFGSIKSLKVFDLVLDLGTLTVQRAGDPIELNKVCVTILTMLMQASPKVVSRQELEFALWGDAPPASDALRSHMYTLRRKVDKPHAVALIHTIHGQGYALRGDDESA